MEKQEMANAWIALQNRVEKCAAQQVELRDQLNQSRVADHRRRLQRVPTWDLVLSTITVIWVGNFAADHIQGLLAAPIAAVPALLLFAFAIVQINLGVRHLIVAGEMDLAKPIVESQRELANLRRLRVKVTQWIFIGALPVWIVFPIVLGQSIFGARFLFALDPAWVVANIVFGIAAIPVINWFLRKSKYAHALQDGFAGKELIEAEEFLKEIQQFQGE